MAVESIFYSVAGMSCPVLWSGTKGSKRLVRFC